MYGFNLQLEMLVVSGAALSVWYSYYNCGRKVSTERDAMGGSYLGPEYSNEEINELKSSGAVYWKLR